MTRHWIVGPTVGALIVGVAWVVLASSRPAEGQQPAALTTLRAAAPLSAVRSADGKLSISYVRQESSSARSDHTINGVKAIEFHPGFVVYRTKDGGGLLPLEKLWYFSWSGPAD
jgi:hypothetical protein